MLGQLHAYYIILQAFTVDFMLLQSLHANPVGSSYFEILQILMPSKRLRPCEVSRPMSIGNDGLHQFLLHSAQGHAREMLRVEPDVRCYLQHSITLVI